MGFPLVIVGLLMVITGARGTYAQFGAQLATDVRGYAPQGIAVAAVGAIGFIPALQQISRWILAFVIIVIFLAQNKGTSGFFSQFQNALNQGPIAPQPVAQGQSTSQVAASMLGPQQGSPLAALSQSLGAGTVNQWLQSLPGIGSWFTPAVPTQ